VTITVHRSLKLIFILEAERGKKKPWKAVEVHRGLLFISESQVPLGIGWKGQQSDEGDNDCMDKLYLLLARKNISSDSTTGSKKNTRSNSLRVEKMHESLPPEVVPPLPLTNQEHIEEELLEEAVADQDEEEPLDVEEDNDATEEEEEEENGDGLASGMPG
jgi:hypothetical protein